MNPAAQIIKDRKEEIVAAWDKQARKEIKASKAAQPLALRNFLPFLLEEVAEILDKAHPDPRKKSSKRLVELSENHGRHRSTSKKYSAEQVIREYLILYRGMAEELSSTGNFTTEIANDLVFILGNSLATSTGSFELALQEMREKLIGVLAHDIRNPISAAFLALDVMDYKDGEERLELIKSMATKNLRRSLNLLEGLLDTVTVRAGEGMALNFSEIDLVPQIKLEHEEGNQIYSAEIRLSCNEKQITGIFDATLVKRALGNLITNAIKYGTQKKPVTIKAVQDPETVFLSVHNFGVPIPTEKQKEIFKFLARTGRDSNKGVHSWGMGLTLVQLVAEAHGGEIRLESDKEHGTTFTLVLKKHANKPGKRRAELNFAD